MAETQVQVPHTGRLTWFFLSEVEKGNESLVSMMAKQHRYERLGFGDRSYRISLQGTISILEQQSEVKLTPKMLIAHLSEYQASLIDIERNPIEYFVGRLTPDIARAWYEQQIQRIREALTEEAS